MGKFIIVSKHDLLKDEIYYTGTGCGWSLLQLMAEVFKSAPIARAVLKNTNKVGFVKEIC